jgi:hypothetical protein
VQFIFKVLPQTPGIFLSFFIVYLSEERKWLECSFAALGEIGSLKATPCFQIVLYCLFIFDQYLILPCLHTDYHSSSIFHSCNYASAEEKKGGDRGPVGQSGYIPRNGRVSLPSHRWVPTHFTYYPPEIHTERHR